MLPSFIFKLSMHNYVLNLHHLTVGKVNQKNKLKHRTMHQEHQYLSPKVSWGDPKWNYAYDPMKFWTGPAHLFSATYSVLYLQIKASFLAIDERSVVSVLHKPWADYLITIYILVFTLMMVKQTDLSKSYLTGRHGNFNTSVTQLILTIHKTSIMW